MKGSSRDGSSEAAGSASHEGSRASVEAPSGLLRIGELSRRVGVGADTLRAWERRYGLLQPERSPGGYRLYTEEDAERVRAMTALMRRGAAAREAAAAVMGAPPASAGDAPRSESPEAISRLLRHALERFDEAGAQASLDRAIAAYGSDAVISQILIPTVRELGERWAAGNATVAQEHFASNLIRGRLIGLGRGWGTGPGPLALLACPPDEQHDLGLAALGVALRGRGWRVTLLGADTPTATLGEAADELEPAAIIVAALTPERLDAVAAELGVLAERHPVLIAGPGASPEISQRSGTTLLAGGPVEAAEWVAQSSESDSPRKAR